MVSDIPPDGGGPKNVAPGGFPTHRMPSARPAHRRMPGIPSPTAAARSATARSTADNTDPPQPAGGADVPRGRGEADLSRRLGDLPTRRLSESEAAGDRRTRAPRQDDGEKSSALAMFFEPRPEATEPDGADVDPLWPASVTRVPTGHRGDTAISMAVRKPPKKPRSPAAGLTGLILLAFIATFFAWFSAGPLWLSLGHSRHGVATVANCPVAGIDERCAEFTADNGDFTATVTLLGPASAQAARGATIPAEMVSRSDTMAYAGDPSSLYLRWVPGLLIVLLCGFGIAWITGAYRLPGRRAKLVALIASLGGPIVIAAGMLAVTW